MPKKNTRTPKTAQRAREEQWRRRLDAQGRTVVETSPVDTDEPESFVQDEGTNGDTVQVIAPAGTMTGARASTTPRTTARTTARAAAEQAPRAGSTSMATAAQRRAASTTARSSRLRPAPTGLSIDEEMHYVRSDIRRLVILTAICLAVLIALSFVIR